MNLGPRLSLVLLLTCQTTVQAVEITVHQEYSRSTQVRHYQLNGFMVDRAYGVPSSFYSSLGATYSRSNYISQFVVSPVSAGNAEFGYEGIKGETVAFNPSNNSVYSSYDFTVTTSRNGTRYSQSTIIHGDTVISEDGFRLESSISPQWSYGDPNFSAFGTTRVDIFQSVDHYVETENTGLIKATHFFDNISGTEQTKPINLKSKDPNKSQHISNESGKEIYYNFPRENDVLGTRGSISTNGTHVNTASPGILAYNISFGDADTLSLPFAFGENKDGSTLEVFFEGGLLASVHGDDYTLDELAFMDIDMTNLKGQSGLLEFIINTTGPNSANVFIPESLATSAVPVPAAVWLFSSGLLGLIGVARRNANG